MRHFPRRSKLLNDLSITFPHCRMKGFMHEKNVKRKFSCIKRVLPKSFHGWKFHAWNCVQPVYPWKSLGRKNHARGETSIVMHGNIIFMHWNFFFMLGNMKFPGSCKADDFFHKLYWDSLPYNCVKGVDEYCIRALLLAIPVICISSFAIVLLVAIKFGKYKMMQKLDKWLKLSYESAQRELSRECAGWLCGPRRCHWPLAVSQHCPGFESYLKHVRMLPVTWGWVLVFAGYTGFHHQLQLASHDL